MPTIETQMTEIQEMDLPALRGCFSREVLVDLPQGRRNP